MTFYDFDSVRGVTQAWPASGWLALYVVTDQEGFEGRESMEFEPLVAFVLTDAGALDAIGWGEVDGPFLVAQDAEEHLGCGFDFVTFVHESKRDEEWVEAAARRVYELLARTEAT